MAVFLLHFHGNGQKLDQTKAKPVCTRHALGHLHVDANMVRLSWLGLVTQRVFIDFNALSHESFRGTQRSRGFLSYFNFSTAFLFTRHSLKYSFSVKIGLDRSTHTFLGWELTRRYEKFLQLCDGGKVCYIVPLWITDVVPLPKCSVLPKSSSHAPRF